MKLKKILTMGLSLSLLAGIAAGCQSVAAGDTTANTSGQAGTAADASQADASGDVTWSENLLDPENPVTVKFYSYSYASPAFGTGFQTMMDNFNNGVGKEKGVILEFVADDTGTKAETDREGRPAGGHCTGLFCRN